MTTNFPVDIMKILIPSDNIRNAYIPSLVEAYQKAGCEVVIGQANFYNSDWIPDMVHFQWPESIFKGNDYSIYGETYNVIKKRIEFYRSKNVIFIWTIHNVKPHESDSKDLDAQVYKLLVNETDIFVHHGKKSVEIMGTIYPDILKKSNLICPHGDYLIQYKDVDKGTAREKLNLPVNAKILMNFGLIKGYKGFDLLKDIFKGWKANNKFLFIAGDFLIGSSIPLRIKRFWLGKIRTRTRKYGYHFDYIHNSDVALFMSACDAIILTHKSGLTSGVIPLAITFKKPIVYPNLGNFEEQVIGWESAKCYQSSNVDSAIKALNSLELNTEVISNKEWLAKNSWDEHVRKILERINDQQK